MRRTVPLFLAGLFLICMCSLMLQIMQTRLLSVMAWYYLAFFAISMAMFGMTAGSLLVYFKADLFPPAAAARASFVDRHCVRDCSGDLDAVDGLHGFAGRSDLGCRGVALAQADPDHPAALCVCRHGDIARAHPKPLAGRHRLLRRSARRGGRLPARAWIAHMDGWRVRTACGRRDRRGGGCLFPRCLARQSRCRNARAFGQPLAGAAASWCAVCSDRFGGLVQQLDPAARDWHPLLSRTGLKQQRPRRWNGTRSLGSGPRTRPPAGRRCGDPRRTCRPSTVSQQTMNIDGSAGVGDVPVRWRFRRTRLPEI